MSGKPDMISTEEQIGDAFDALHRVLAPLTVGDGDDDPVREARLGLQALYLFRQWARHGAPAPLPRPKARARSARGSVKKSPPKRGKTP